MLVANRNEVVVNERRAIGLSYAYRINTDLFYHLKMEYPIVGFFHVFDPKMRV